MTVRRINSTFCSLPLNWIVFLHPPLLRNSPLSKALEARDIGWAVSENSIIISQQFCPKNSIRHIRICSAPFLFWSRSQEWPMTAMNSANTIRNFVRITFTFLYIFFLSPYIDMKMIMPSNCSGSHCRSFITSWICLRRPNVVNPGNIFHSNSIDSPSTRFKSFKWLLSKYHFIFSFRSSFGYPLLHLPDRALSLRRRRSWHLRSDEFCHTASLSRSMCAPRNQSMKHQRSLTGSWSFFQFLWKTSRNSRNDYKQIVISDHSPDQEELLLEVVFVNIHQIAAFTSRTSTSSTGPRS